MDTSGSETKQPKAWTIGGEDPPSPPRDKEDGEAEEEEINLLPKQWFHFFYNINHALKMVIVRPHKDKLLDNDVFRHWIQATSSYEFIKRKDGSSEAVLHFGTVARGDGAYLDIKSSIEDADVEIFHPSAMPSLKIQKYWQCLKSVSSIAKPPVTPEIGEQIFSRQIIIEGVPDSVTEDELLVRYPEAVNVMCLPLVKGLKGLRVVEFDSEMGAMKFLREHQDDQLDGQSVKMTKYMRRANEWEEKKDRTPYEKVTLTDEDRVEKCKRLKELQGLAEAEVVNRRDVFGEEKILQHYKVLQEIEEIERSLNPDTDRRRLLKESIPEESEMQSTYTKHTESREWQRSRQHRQAMEAYGVQKDRQTKRSISPSSEDYNKCFNCGGKGHFARDCPSEKEGVECYNCGRSGHFARDCGKKTGDKRSRSPFNDNRNKQRRFGDNDKPGFSMTNDNKDRGSMATKNCYKCRAVGHFARDCPQGDPPKGDTCFNCGGVGHFSRNCASGDPKLRTRTDRCFVCGGVGHYARECPNNRKQGGSQNNSATGTNLQQSFISAGTSQHQAFGSAGTNQNSYSVAGTNQQQSYTAAGTNQQQSYRREGTRWSSEGTETKNQGGEPNGNPPVSSGGDTATSASDMIANMLRMANPGEVATILQNFSQSLNAVSGGQQTAARKY